jgi:hypothetical protein
MSDHNLAPCCYCRAVLGERCKTRTGYRLATPHKLRADLARVVRNVTGAR